MLVYRVENIVGCGPYTSISIKKTKDLTKKLCEKHNGSPQHPCSWSDIPGFFEKVESKDYRHGFLSIGQLKTWFRGFEQDLKDNGFFISTYEVPSESVFIGSRQVVYLWEHSERIQEMPI